MHPSLDPPTLGVGVFFLFLFGFLPLLAVAVFYLLLFSFVFVVVGGGTIVWILALISCIKNESATDNTKIVWVLVILFTHFLGGLIYLLIRRPQRIRELGR